MTRTTLPGSVICGVGLMALGTLFLEVVLTRIFAVTLWYHFGFLAISLALLGTAASAVLCFVQPRLASDEDHMRNMMRSALAFAVSVPITIVVHLGMSLPPPSAGLPFYAVFAFQLLLLFVTFALSGLCISIALFRYANQIGALYFFDLVGASLGSLLVVPLLFQRSAIALTFGVSAVGCLSAIAFQLGEKSESKRFTRFIVPSLLVGAIAFVLLACFNDQLGILKISRVKSYSAHRVQREEGEKVFEKWSPVSRVAVFAPSKRDGWETMLVTNDAGASTMLRRFDDRDFDRARRMVEEDARQIVHAVKRDASVLIIGSAGGTDVLTSLAMNQSRITAVEINPVIGELVTTLQANYIGHIFDDPRVTLHIQEGRNFAARSADQYDIIEISMIDSWAGAAAGAYVFNENSLYTYEAVRDYYQHLKPDGVLSVTRYLVWDESLRLTATYVKYLRDLGLDQIPERIVVVAEGDTHYRRATVLLKNGRFTAEEASTLAAVG
ncbi:MAG TPA: hypothetical protein VHO25_20475, partial [Polyangiaceae bacterium]|nr:hypothetical protein [Polyangiaceae bacterium]